jgi:hypothetical protein
MDLELTPAEAEQFQAALLSAFPNRGNLEQLVFFRLGQELDQLVPPGAYANNVTNLIKWANAEGKAWALLDAAYEKVPGNPKLRAFYQQIKVRLPLPNDNALDTATAVIGKPLPPNGAIPPRVLTPSLRQQLVDAVLLIPGAETPEGRSAYLLGLPASPTRVPGNAQADLNTIFAQLDGLGRLDSGQWPVLLVIDNILPFAKGFAIHSVISALRQTLEDAYGAH